MKAKLILLSKMTVLAGVVVTACFALYYIKADGGVPVYLKMFASDVLPRRNYDSWQRVISSGRVLYLYQSLCLFPFP